MRASAVCVVARADTHAHAPASTMNEVNSFHSITPSPFTSICAPAAVSRGAGGRRGRAPHLREDVAQVGDQLALADAQLLLGALGNDGHHDVHELVQVQALLVSLKLALQLADLAPTAATAPATARQRAEAGAAERCTAHAPCPRPSSS